MKMKKSYAAALAAAMVLTAGFSAQAAFVEEGQNANLHDVTVSSITTNNGAQLNGGANIHNGANVYVKEGDKNALTVNGGGFVVNKLAEAEDGSLVPGETVYKVDGEGNVTGANGEFNGTLTVQGETNINADANVTGQLTAAGLQNANGTFNADENGNLKGNSVTTNRNSLNQVGGVSMIGGRLDADGGIFDDLKAHDSIQVGDSSNAKETTRIDGGSLSTGTLTVHDKLNADAISGNTLEIGKNAETGKPTFTVSEEGWVTAEYGADISGVRLNGGRVLASGGLSVGDGKYSVDGATGNMSTEGSLTVEDGATINGGTTMNGGATVNGGLTADTISAMNGNFNVNEEGIRFRTEDAADLTTYHYYFDMNNENGISFGHSNGASMSLNENGVTFAYGDKTTHINGDEISTGTVHAGLVQASDMYRGDANNPDNQVVTKGELDKAVAAGTENAVKYDDNGELHAGKEGTGKLDLNNDGSAALTSGNGEHSISVTDDGTTVTGGMTVSGGLKIDNGDGTTSSVVTDADLSEVQEKVEQNTSDISGIKTDVSGIKTEIGVNDDGSYKTIDNGAKDVITGINNNTASIGTIKDQIGATGENGALKLSNGADTIESGINANTTMIQQQGQAINALGDRVNDLGDEIDSVGAISSALAGLHPLDYDGTGSKFQLSAAMGSYDSTQAMAIGGFYHFNEDVMLSLGGATSFSGDHKTAGNIGVTFRVGQGSSGKKVNSDDVLAQLNAMNEKIAALEAENQQLSEKVAALEGGEGAEAAEAE